MRIFNISRKLAWNGEETLDSINLNLTSSDVVSICEAIKTSKIKDNIVLDNANNILNVLTPLISKKYE